MELFKRALWRFNIMQRPSALKESNMIKSRNNAKLVATSGRVAVDQAPVRLLKYGIELLDSKDWRLLSRREAVIESIFLCSAHCSDNSVVVHLLNSAAGMLISKQSLHAADRDQAKHKIEQAIRLLRAKVDILIYAPSRKRAISRIKSYKL